ncbi:MAG TPA: DsbA family protein [Stellaceae bacterium]|jgi:protein-disulfide isomerase|nr:DsbA family protein [Stellaceae bacterium]
MKLDQIRRCALACALALVAAMTAPALSRAGDTFSPAQKSAIDQAIHDYLLAHPEAVLDALKAAQEKSDREVAAEARRQIAVRRQELVADPDDLVQGDPKGDATIVEFFDYRCPYCKEIEPTLDALLLEDKRLRIVYKEFPILGEASIYAARAALASRSQGKYPAFHRAMMAQKGNITDETVLKVAASVGLDLKTLKAEMDSPAIARIIKDNFALAEALHIQGTPGIIVGDTLIPGAVDPDTLRKEIAAARKGS